MFSDTFGWAEIKFSVIWHRFAKLNTMKWAYIILMYKDNVTVNTDINNMKILCTGSHKFRAMIIKV